jgi:hypothetical protein
MLLLDESDSGFEGGAEIICLCRVKFDNEATPTLKRYTHDQ